MVIHVVFFQHIIATNYSLIIQVQLTSCSSGFANPDVLNIRICNPRPPIHRHSWFLSIHAHPCYPWFVPFRGSCPFVHFVVVIGQRPLPPLILEGESVTSAYAISIFECRINVDNHAKRVEKSRIWSKNRLIAS